MLKMKLLQASAVSWAVIAAMGWGLARPVAVHAVLSPVVTETGRIFFSIDGLGTNDFAGGTIDVEKPAGATVRKAFLSCAAVLFSGISDGDVSIDATAVTWDQTITSASGFTNAFVDVTALLKPGIDAAPAGRTGVLVVESAPFSMDGCALGVVFDDPNQSRDSTVIVLFGGQETAGDSFAITLAEPLDLPDASSQADMGLAISFGAQDQFGLGGSHLCAVDSPMDSQVDVNGQRLTSCAGNADDGVGSIANGMLFTVGGLDDSNDNPADPFQRAADGGLPRITEDELYDLKPFVSTGDTLITVDTVNPSADDNIFLAYFITSVPSIIGEGIVLAPLSDVNPVGTQHTVTATVVNDLGDPVSDRTVTFTVQTGPNVGATGMVATNGFGEASFTYTGSGGAGTDAIVATMVDSQSMLQTSNSVEKVWFVFDPFGGLVRTPSRNLRLTLTRPTPDTEAVRCAETDPADPDFDDLPFTPFPNGVVELEVLLSEGDGMKDVCCEFRESDGTILEPVCSAIELDESQQAPPAAVAAPTLSFPMLTFLVLLLLAMGGLSVAGKSTVLRRR